jgi:ABC-type branched-subunit amino acid transport system substrate-binding protein
MVDHLFKDKSIKRISVFYQNDSYGQAGLEGVRRALARRDMQILNEAHYPRNTVDVEPAVKALLSTNPGAVIMVGTYQPCAKFIQLMRQAGSEAIFLNVSFVGADALAIVLANEGLGVVITQVVPYPFDKRIPVVAEFHNLMRQYMPKAEPGFVSLEGFLCAKALCKILLETADPMTRNGFIETAEKQSGADLGGFSVSFSPSDHQGSDLVYFTQVGPGGFVSPIRNLSDLYEYKR